VRRVKGEREREIRRAGGEEVAEDRACDGRDAGEFVSEEAELDGG
jgi:hypothetical protein